MDITLISSCANIYSFGIRILSACLKKDGHKVKIIFLPGDFQKRYEDRILDRVVELSRASGLIGISLMTNYFENVAHVTKRLKTDLNIPVLWGGIHPTIRPEECLNYADMVCVGDGEEALTKLVRQMQDEKDFHNVPGIWLKAEGNIIKNKILPHIQDLNTIPFQDYDYDNHYVITGHCISKMSEELLEKYTQGCYWTMPTRGCPFGCSYCANNTLNRMYPTGNPIRKRSIGNIIEELVQVKEKLPIMHTIYFDDDAFFLYTTEEIAEFSQQYKEKIKLPLIVTGATPLTLTREKLSLLVDAGLIHIRMGIESGSERTKRLYKRNYSNQHVVETTKVINEFKDKIDIPQYDIIVDNPWENDDDLIKTLTLLTEVPPPYHLAIYSLTFYPGTELYEKAKQEGIINDDLKDVYHKHYHEDCMKSYLNRLFFLLHELEGRLSKKTMFLLTNRLLRKSRISWLILHTIIIFNINHNPVYLNYKQLLQGALKDIRKGDWSRINRYIKRLFLNIFAKYIAAKNIKDFSKMHRIIDKENFRNWNEKMAVKYNPDTFHERSNFIIKFIEGLRVKKIIKELSLGENGRILEVGCGAGNIIQKISYGDITGVDISEYLVKIAKSKTMNNRVLVADGQSLPFKNHSFNKVICSEVLEHVLSPESVLKEISRVLTNSGMVIITIPYEKSINRIKKVLIRLRLFKLLESRHGYSVSRDMQDEWHIHSFRINDFRRILSNYYEICKVYPSPSRFLPLRYIIKAYK